MGPGLQGEEEGAGLGAAAPPTDQRLEEVVKDRPLVAVEEFPQAFAVVHPPYEGVGLEYGGRVVGLSKEAALVREEAAAQEVGVIAWEGVDRDDNRRPPWPERGAGGQRERGLIDGCSRNSPF